MDGDTNGNDDVPQDSILNTVDSAEPEMPQILPTDQNDAPWERETTYSTLFLCYLY